MHSKVQILSLLYALSTTTLAAPKLSSRQSPVPGLSATAYLPNFSCDKDPTHMIPNPTPWTYPTNPLCFNLGPAQTTSSIDFVYGLSADAAEASVTGYTGANCTGDMLNTYFNSGHGTPNEGCEVFTGGVVSSVLFATMEASEGE
ncbi:hypothetical protein MMC12_003499 [Toensbergia leucococca]|nr:hypothetical protein [Toensbergia leucococca]